MQFMHFFLSRFIHYGQGSACYFHIRNCIALRLLELDMQERKEGRAVLAKSRDLFSFSSSTRSLYKLPCCHFISDVYRRSCVALLVIVIERMAVGMDIHFPRN